MSRTKVVDWVDIEAPRQEVFELIMNLERRMQLSPLWGVAKIDEISTDYPSVGSSYHVQLVKGEPVSYDTIITEYEPGRKFAYRLTSEQKSTVSWSFQDSAQGMRVIYEEQFDVDQQDKEAFTASVHEVVHKWMQNIKRYSELRGSRIRLVVKWLLDRFYLRMRMDQRRVVQTILVMQFVGIISFIMAAIAMGIATLVS
jgi:uncharacterized protein YndB with AHSA1/START domain